MKNDFWHSWPLYGLRVTDDNLGTAKPIFGDATLVSPQWYEGRVASLVEDLSARAALTTSPSREWLSDEDLKELPLLPTEQEIHIAPHCYVAVRRTKFDEAEPRAQEIRALLTGAVRCALARRELVECRSPPTIYFGIPSPDILA